MAAILAKLGRFPMVACFVDHVEGYCVPPHDFSMEQALEYGEEQVRSGVRGSSLHSGIEFGRSRTGEDSSGGRKRGVV